MPSYRNILQVFTLPFKPGQLKTTSQRQSSQPLLTALVLLSALAVMFAHQVHATPNATGHIETDINSVEIQFTLPVIETGQYQRPYVAVWVEDNQGKIVKTLTVWHEDKKWLKDLRRWWRKTGRYQEEDLDAVTGATKAPGRFTLSWDGKDYQGNPVKAGQYQLCFEASREHGDRSLLKQKFNLPDQSKTYRIKAGSELGPVEIKVL